MATEQRIVLDEEACANLSRAPGRDIEIDKDGMEEIMKYPWSTSRG